LFKFSDVIRAANPYWESDETAGQENRQAKTKTVNNKQSMKTTSKTVHTMKRMAAKLVLSLAVCALVTPGAASAQGVTPFFPFKDSFNGPIDDNRPVSWYPAYGTETFTIHHRNLILTTPAVLVPNIFSLGSAIVFSDSAPMVAENTSAQAVVRVSDSFAFASIFAKAQAAPPAGDGIAYVARIGGNGFLGAEIFSYAPPTVQTNLPTSLDPRTTDVVIQLDVVGNKLTASAWAKNKPNMKYHVTLTDPAAPRPAGALGVGFGGCSEADENIAGVSATFRSFKIKKIKNDRDGDRD
jgi:hypothetical protein